MKTIVVLLFLAGISALIFHARNSRKRWEDGLKSGTRVFWIVDKKTVTAKIHSIAPSRKIVRLQSGNVLLSKWVSIKDISPYETD